MLDLVTLNKNNQPTTTSKILADRFNKVHRDVVRAINNLDIPEDFRVRNFAQSKFKADNINGLEYDCYEMTRDGFTLLAMGFTGKKAMEWKVKFIEAFNAMETRLKAIYPCGEVAVREHTRSLPAGKKEIVLSEKAKTEIGGIVKAVVQAELSKVFEPVGQDGEHHPSGMPFGNWAAGAVHAVGAMQSEYRALRKKQEDALKLLSIK